MTVASTMHDRGAGSFTGSERAARLRQFEAARRHSRFVRLLRLAVPVGLLTCLAVVIAAAYFNPLRMLAKARLPPGSDTATVVNAVAVAPPTSWTVIATEYVVAAT